MAILRLSTNADMPHIIHVTYEAWQDVGPSILTRDILSTITHQVLEQKRLANIKRDGFRSYVALVGDQIVGYIDGGSPREEYGDNEIYSLFVHPKYHRIGIAKNLLSAFLEQTQGSTFLWTFKDNPKSLLFYQARGGIIQGTFMKPYYGTELETCCVVFNATRATQEP